VRRWPKTFLRLAPVILVACVASVIGLVAFRALPLGNDVSRSSSEIGNYLQTLGGIYAVLLAFVVFVVWGQFNEARTFIEREASAIVDLHRTSSGLPRATRTLIQNGLREYTDAVLDEEWTAMADGDEAKIEAVGHRLDTVWLAVHGCQPLDTCQHAVYSEILSQFNELADLRTNRLTSARARVPSAMRVLLYTGAVLVTGSIYLVDIPVLWVHATVTASLAGAIAHVLYLIEDLDDAFAGDSHISKAPFERARSSFARVAHLVDIDKAS
jgi:Protein of unknown function (DUF4239)